MNNRLSQNCHPERSEGSGTGKREILRSAQNDVVPFETVSKRFEDVQSRRQFFIGAARCASLGLLCAAGGLLLAKRRRLMREGVCINAGLCEGCGIFEKCRLPLRRPATPSALPAKQDFDRVDNG